MKEIIKVGNNTEGSVVSARELHKFLESKQYFSHWIKNRIEKYDLKEGVDFYKKYFDIYGNEVESNFYWIHKIEYFLTKESGKLIVLSENNVKSVPIRNTLIKNEVKSNKILSKFSEIEYSLNLDNIFVKNDKIFIYLDNLAKLINESIEILISKLDKIKVILPEDSIILNNGGGEIELDEMSTLLLLKDYPLDVYSSYLNPSERLSTLQTGSDVELMLIYKSGVCSNFFEIESLCHEKFKDYNVRGEWFNVDSSEVISFLENQKFVLTSNLL